MLSKRERSYLQKPEKIKSSYRRNLEYRLRKKVRRAMKDLVIVFERMDRTHLRFYREDDFSLSIPLELATQTFRLRNDHSETIGHSSLSAALERAGKRCNYEKLVCNEKYRTRMIDWLRKREKETGEKYYHRSLSIEEQVAERNRILGIRGELHVKTMRVKKKARMAHWGECPDCRTASPSGDSNYCYSCGHLLMQCVKCQSFVKPGVDVCPTCKSRLA